MAALRGTPPSCGRAHRALIEQERHEGDTMNGIILGALAVMWVVVLGWEAVSNMRDGRRRSDPMRNFRSQLSVLGRTVPKTVSAANRLDTIGAPWRAGRFSPPQGRAAAAQRRRVISIALAGGLTLAGIVWFVTSTPVAGAAVLAFGGLLVGFAWLSMRRRQLAEERARVVTYLPTASRPLDVTPARRRAN